MAYWYLIAGTIFTLIAAAPGSAQRQAGLDSQSTTMPSKGAQAETAWQEACRLKEELANSPGEGETALLRCIRAFQSVYRISPHYHAADDAVFEAGKLLQEMATRPDGAPYVEKAVRQFRFLISDYPSSKYAGEARHRLAALEAAAPAAPGTARAELAGAPIPSPEPAQVKSIRYWTNADFTRVSIDLDREVSFSQSRLSDPERLFFDLSSAALAQDLANRTVEVGDSRLQRIRIARNRPEVLRIVLDLAGRSTCSVSRLADPPRITVDIRNGSGTALAATPAKETAPAPAAAPRASAKESSTPDGGAGISAAPSVLLSREEPPLPATARAPIELAPRTNAAGGSLPAQPPATLPTVRNPENVVLPKPATPIAGGDRTLTRALGLKIGRIVIDPGHGGHDHGTAGRNGLMEKDLVLQVGRLLRRMLTEKLGAEVLMTRDEDAFISLEERTEFANREQADLFISIHANSSKSRGASGVETYFLDFARTSAEREVAARENATTVHNYRDLEELVKKIARADKMAESRELAALVQTNLYGEARKVLPSTKNRGVRSAPFVVLIGAKMPSVLVEVAFLSNPRDEKLLQKEPTLQNIAKALYLGIEGYMKALGGQVAQTQANTSP